LSEVQTTSPELGDDDLIWMGDGNDIVLGGIGADYINMDASGNPVGTDTGDDVMIGDNGRAEFDTSSGVSLLQYIETTNPLLGDGDYIFSSDGSDVVLGGYCSDRINTDANGDPVGTDTGDDIILGDNGFALFDTSSGVKSIPVHIETTDPDAGCDDFIFSGGGDDVLIGGAGSDELTAGAGDDVILGDNGGVHYTDGLVDHVYTSDASNDTGGDDWIDAGDGDDMAFGGAGDDTMSGGLGDDILVGDNGEVLLVGGLLDFLTTENSAVGGDDWIDGGGNDDILAGGIHSDTLLGGPDSDILFGDNGTVKFFNGQPWIAETTPYIYGSPDFLNGQGGTDILFGGEGTDSGVGEFPEDALLGEYGRVVIENGKIVEIFPPIQLLFGNPMNNDTGVPGGIGSIVPEPVTGSGMTVPVGGGMVITTEARVLIVSGTGVTGLLPTHHGAFGLFPISDYPGLAGSASVVSSYTFPDGTIERTFSNGFVETIQPDGTIIITSPDGTVSMLMPDGTFMVTAPDGTQSTMAPDGTVTTVLPDGTIIKKLPDGTIIKTMPDGTVVTTMPDGTIITAAIGSQADARDALMQKGQRGIELNALVAGAAGWGLASPKPPGDRTALNRNQFKALDREKEQRRFARFDDFLNDFEMVEEKEKFSSNGFHLLPFIERRSHGSKRRNDG
jgi:hypothetical protein